MEIVKATADLWAAVGVWQYVPVCTGYYQFVTVCDSLWQPARHKLLVTVTLPTLCFGIVFYVLLRCMQIQSELDVFSLIYVKLRFCHLL